MNGLIFKSFMQIGNIHPHTSNSQESFKVSVHVQKGEEFGWVICRFLTKEDSDNNNFTTMYRNSTYFEVPYGGKDDKFYNTILRYCLI